MCKFTSAPCRATKRYGIFTFAGATSQKNVTGAPKIKFLRPSHLAQIILLLGRSSHKALWAARHNGHGHTQVVVALIRKKKVGVPNRRAGGRRGAEVLLPLQIRKFVWQTIFRPLCFVFCAAAAAPPHLTCNHCAFASFFCFCFSIVCSSSAHTVSNYGSGSVAGFCHIWMQFFNLALINCLLQVKKRQQRVAMILESKHIDFTIIDITEPGKDKEKDFMQQNATAKGETVSWLTELTHILCVFSWLVLR